MPACTWSAGQLADALGTSEQHGRFWRVLCPCHDDKNPSLDIQDVDGGCVFTCRAGCDQKALFLAVKKAVPDAFANGRVAPEKTPPPWEREVEAAYDYTDEAGAVLFQCVRFRDRKNPRFMQRKPIGADRWEWNLRDVRHVLYRLPEIAPRQAVVLTEGEKDADTVSGLGITATCNPMGAGKWKTDYSEALRGKRVAIYADADQPGRDHAAKVAVELHGMAASVRVLVPPQPHKDISEWIAAGATKADIAAAINAAPIWQPADDLPLVTTPQDDHPARGYRPIRASDLDLHPPEWLIPGVVETDALGMLFGAPSSGKSFLALDWACRVAKGGEHNGAPVKQGPVFYMAGEGRAGVARRLNAWCIRNEAQLTDMPLYVSSQAISLADRFNAELVQAAADTIAQECGTLSLVIVDTLARHLLGADENSNTDVGAVIATLDAIRSTYRCTVLIVHHTGHAASERARGASALHGAMDAEYLVSRGEDKVIRVQATKAKDAELPEPWAYRLASVELDIVGDDGQPVTSAVLDPTEWVAAPKPSAVASGKSPALALSILQVLVDDKADESARYGRPQDEVKILMGAWKEGCRDAGMVKQRVYEAVLKLENDGKIVINGDFVSIL